MNLIDLAQELEHDPMRKAFVLTAVESYARNVMADDSEWDNTLVNKDLWQSIAKQFLTMLEKEYH